VNLVAWAYGELASVQLPDARLDNRLIQMVEDFSQHPEASCLEALGSKAAVDGAYRFWQNERVLPEAILAPHAEKAALRAQEHPVVLVAQDTTEIDLTSHPGTQGAGYLGSLHSRGLWLHSLLAISPQGVPLGLLRQFRWVRPFNQWGKRHKRRRRKIQEKESQRWLDGLAATEATLPQHPHVVLMGDREADIFDLFAAPRPSRIDLLVRVCRTRRRVEHPEKYLDRALQASPVRGWTEVEVPARGARPARTAKLAVRWLSLEVRAPRHGRKRPSVPLTFILVEETDAPTGVTPIRWILATTLPVNSLEEAVRYVQWYSFRWTIEQFHFVLKSGCRIEELQLKTVARMERAIATFSIVAWRLLWLTLQARQTPDAPCTAVLEEHEWKALYATVHHSTKLPSEPPTLREAVRMIAKLGGFLGRQGDGEPGVQSLWRGLRRLHDISETWRLLESHVQLPTG
jgi:hypothetical protein